MKKTALAFIALVLTAGAAQAQSVMPAPQRMPRIPVSREALAEQRREMAQVPHTLQGPAAVIDGERLRIGEIDLRLFGIVPPQLAASYGPQARAALDQQANGQPVTCAVRDRDRDGRLLATCTASNGNDMALELLKRGLAVSARGSIAGTELATSYLAAEQAAENQKIGLWSMTTPPAVTMSPVTVTPPQATHSESALALPQPGKDEKTAPRSDKAAMTDAMAQQAAIDAAMQQNAQAHSESASWNNSNRHMGFFERYQALIAGILMFATALSIITAVWAQKRRDRRDETRAVAAALRGELMAARGVCIGRIKSIATEEQDLAATWPRIRSTLYQAYVGRLGLLGAELARQVASIYGQSSDYSSLYSPNGAAHDQPKRNALETLARHIDEILPRLASIEQTGSLPVMAYVAAQPRSRYDAPAPRPLPAQNANYRTIAAPAKKPVAKMETLVAYEDVTPKKVVSAVPPAPAPTAAIKPTALWESVRGFIQNHRNAIAQAPSHGDTHISEYAAMIEADMARYPYAETIDSLDITPNKKQG